MRYGEVFRALGAAPAVAALRAARYNSACGRGGWPREGWARVAEAGQRKAVLLLERPQGARRRAGLGG